MGVVQISDLTASDGHITAIPNRIQLAVCHGSSTEGGFVVIVVVQRSLRTIDGAVLPGHLTVVANGHTDSCGDGAVTGDGQIAGSAHINGCIVTGVSGSNGLAVQIQGDLLLHSQHIGAQIHIFQQNDGVTVSSCGHSLRQSCILGLADLCNIGICGFCKRGECHSRAQHYCQNNSNQFIHFEHNSRFLSFDSLVNIGLARLPL